MESPFIQYEWRIEDLKKENTELKERITFLGDLVYFKAVCDCYMATKYHSTAWIVSVNIEKSIIELGYNY